MLEAHVALVDGLEAGSAPGDGREPEGGGNHTARTKATGEVSAVRAPCATRMELDGEAARHYIGPMFTGLVSGRGLLAGREERGPSARVVVRPVELADLAKRDEPLALGESISVDGACLSVVAGAAGRVRGRRHGRDARAYDAGRPAARAAG